jgi:hypothetical protein
VQGNWSYEQGLSQISFSLSGNPLQVHLLLKIVKLQAAVLLEKCQSLEVTFQLNVKIRVQII